MADELKEVHSRRIKDAHFKNTTGLCFPSNYLSNSQIGLFRICPKAYEFSYIQRIREKRGPSAVVGLSVHKFLETMTEMRKPKLPEKDLIDCFEDIFSTELKGNGAEYTIEEKEEVNMRKKKIIPSLLSYYEKEAPNVNTLLIEKQVDAPVPIARKKFNSVTKKVTVEPCGEISIIGFVDSIITKHKTEFIKEAEVSDVVKKFVDLQIQDFKTGAKKDATEIIADYQLPFYSYATGIDKIRIDNIIVSKAKTEKGIKPNYAIFEQTIEAFHLENMLAEYCSAAYSIGKGYFTDSGGYSCDENTFPKVSLNHWKCSPKYCGHWYHCRGDKVDSYLKKVAIREFGSHIEKE